MIPPPAVLERLRFLARVAHKEARHLALTDGRLFTVPLTPERLAELEGSPDLAERVDAFVGRSARLQDTLGDKLLPALLDALGEKTGAAIDNLDRAERLGLIPSAERWMAMRSCAIGWCTTMWKTRWCSPTHWRRPTPTCRC